MKAKINKIVENIIMIDLLMELKLLFFRLGRYVLNKQLRVTKNKFVFYHCVSEMQKFSRFIKLFILKLLLKYYY